MKWIAISGGWRKNNDQTERDARREAREIISRGDGIVSGGALGIDFFATDEALKHDTAAAKIKIFLPATLEIFSKHYWKRADEGVITHDQAEKLINQLETIKRTNPAALIENLANQTINTEVYYERICEIIKAADELVAFHINKSAGTQYTIDQARVKGIPVMLFEYNIE
jgi:hypothetical protein